MSQPLVVAGVPCPQALRALPAQHSLAGLSHIAVGCLVTAPHCSSCLNGAFLFPRSWKKFLLGPSPSSFVSVSSGKQDGAESC